LLTCRQHALTINLSPLGSLESLIACRPAGSGAKTEVRALQPGCFDRCKEDIHACRFPSAYAKVCRCHQKLRRTKRPFLAAPLHRETAREESPVVVFAVGSTEAAAFRFQDFVRDVIRYFCINTVCRDQGPNRDAMYRVAIF